MIARLPPGTAALGTLGRVQIVAEVGYESEAAFNRASNRSSRHPPPGFGAGRELLTRSYRCGEVESELAMIGKKIGRGVAARVRVPSSPPFIPHESAAGKTPNLFVDESSFLNCTLFWRIHARIHSEKRLKAECEDNSTKQPGEQESPGKDKKFVSRFTRHSTAVIQPESNLSCQRDFRHVYRSS